MLYPSGRLGDVCLTFTGGTPSRTKTEYFGGGIPWVKITDMLQGKVLRTDETISDLGIANSSAKVLPKGTVLISIFATIGRTAVLGIDAATNQAIAGVVPKDTDQLDSDYLRYFLDSKHGFLNREARGVAQPNINQGILKALEIPLPPIDEQRRIVDLLARAEGIVRLRREAEKKAAELIPALFIDMFGDPATNPKGWPEHSLGDIAEVVSGVTKGRKFGDKQTVEAPYLRVANVQAGHIDLTELKTIEVLPRDVEQLALQNGDVVLTEGGDFDKLGRGALWEHDIANCIHQNHVFRVRCKQSMMLPQFFVIYLQSSRAREYFLRCAKRTTNLASINMTQLRALPVVLPTMDAQREFVERFSAGRSIQSQQAAATAKAQETFNALLASVFSPPLNEPSPPRFTGTPGPPQHRQPSAPDGG
jgi:type I restriction enzyme S subunit